MNICREHPCAAPLRRRASGKSKRDEREQQRADQCECKNPVACRLARIHCALVTSISESRSPRWLHLCAVRFCSTLNTEICFTAQLSSFEVGVIHDAENQARISSVKR